MNRAYKAEKIGQILDKLYPQTPIPLNHSNGYTLLVAVMLSAQTTDKKVNQVTANLFKQVYNKANDDIKQKLNTKNEKQLVRILGGMWKKFGKNITIGSSL